MNRTLSIPLITSAAVLLMSAAFSPAYATPTKQQVTQARADCHARKVRVKALEASSAADGRLLHEERAVWEQTCALATAMMDSRAGVVAPQPAVARAATATGEVASFETCNERGRSAEPKAP